jgi:hypothetical protein
METDVIGKINEKRLGFNNTLLPLFEAIVNSMQAIEERDASSIGLIRVDIKRSGQTLMDLDGAEGASDIIDFEITDDGIGFNEANYESFTYAHSTYKKGGKGIGRFTWLRAFQKAEITSCYKEKDKWYLRKFNFEATKNGIEDHTHDVLAGDQKFSTTVKLVNLKKEYVKWCNGKTEDIALKIIEHAFIYFLNPSCPRIELNEKGKKPLVVNDLFRVFTKQQVENKDITIRDNKFKLSIVKIFNNKRIDNKIHYCANSREVDSDKISIDIPEFDNFLTDKENNAYSIAIYVEGDFLDENVNEERTVIKFSKGDIDFPNKTTQEELRRAITEFLQTEYQHQIEDLSDIRLEKVKNFVSGHPRYKQLLKYKADRLKRIPSTYSDERMEIEVFKIQQELELDLKKEAAGMLKFIETEEDTEKFNESHKALYEKIIAVGNSKLSEYVIHRKLVIELFDKLLKKKACEKAIHRLIFPLQTFSDEISFEDHNLWMLDEKLSYHKYLASDKSFKRIEPLDSESTERPDIIIFNRPFAFSSNEKPYDSIVLIEFKRPMRDDYTDDENPITQINKYAREIINSETKDKYDREFNLRPNTPIYAYIVCDLTKKLKAHAEDTGFTLLPDGDGYFFFNSNYNMYIEITSFDRILKNSKASNRVLFEKLNLS